MQQRQHTGASSKRIGGKSKSRGRLLLKTAALVVVATSAATASAFALSSSSAPPSSSSASAASAPTALATPGGSTTAGGGFNSISCDGPTTCIAVGADANGNADVGVSKNSGNTFATGTLPASTPVLNAVSCVGGSTCVAVGSHDILNSSDNGLTWTSHQVRDLGTISLLGAGCQSSTLCVAAGMESVQIDPNGASYLVNQAVIWTSADGGQTWKKAAVPPGVAGIMAVACPTASRCIAAGSSVLESNDAGQSWAQVPVNGGVGQLFSITCPSSSTCLAVGPNALGPTNPSLPGDAVETTDGGTTFEAMALPASSASVFKVSCSTSTNCVAGGATGDGASAPVFLNSSDGGSTWANATPPPSFKAISDISCPSGGSCVAVGSATSGNASAASTASLSPSGQWTSTPATLTLPSGN